MNRTHPPSIHRSISLMSCAVCEQEVEEALYGPADRPGFWLRTLVLVAAVCFAVYSLTWLKRGAPAPDPRRTTF
jgi:hypothetical protein